MKPVSLILSLLLLPGPALAEGLPDLGGRVVTVAVENAFPPMQFVYPPTGEAMGWEYDAMNEIARRLNFKVEYEAYGWPTVWYASVDGSADIGMDMFFHSDHRAELVDFSEPYYWPERVLLVQAGGAFTHARNFPGFFDYEANDPFEAGLVGVAENSPTHEHAISALVVNDENLDVLRLYKSFEDVLAALRLGEIDVTIIDGVKGRQLAQNEPDVFAIVEDSNPEAPDEFGGIRFVLPLGSDLREPINAAIAQMVGDGSFDALNVKWFIDNPIADEAVKTVEFGRGIHER